MKFNLKEIFKKTFNKKEKESFKKDELKKDLEILKSIKKTPKNTFEPKKEHEIEGILFKIGDKVICRSNEPYPIIIGKIIEFWDNEGKWPRPVPVVRNNRNGKKFNVHGIIKPYSEGLLDTLKNLKPLEQWNYLAPKEAQYTQEEILKKEEFFKKREKILPNKK
jgi:hypothetical protein